MKRHKTIEELDQEQLNQNPLEKLNKKQTKILESFFNSDEENYSNTRNPEIKQVERFLSHA